MSYEYLFYGIVIFFIVAMNIANNNRRKLIDELKDTTEKMDLAHDEDEYLMLRARQYTLINQLRKM